jgi:hypothetical protein
MSEVSLLISIEHMAFTAYTVRPEPYNCCPEHVEGSNFQILI